MRSANRASSDDPPAGPQDGHGSATRSGVVLLMIVGTLQVVYGVAAIIGVSELRESVRDIEENPNYGKLYLSLTGWGILLLLIGLVSLVAARSLEQRREHGRMLGLCAALVGLGTAFFTLAIFHVASLISVVLLLIALYVLSYLVEDPPASSRPF